jgi:hypothetical protein
MSEPAAGEGRDMMHTLNTVDLEGQDNYNI